MFFRAGFLVALSALLAACTTTMAAQQPTLRNIQALRAPEIPALSLGAFELAPGLPARMDRSISIRADSVKAPGDGSFSHYLRQTFETELRAAGKLDESAPTVVSAQLTRSEIGTALSGSRGELGARFVVTRNGQTLYDRELVVNGEWASSFLGAIAIPEAMDRYTALYQDLVAALLNDPEFHNAVRQN
jgi:hypothetical protein